MRVCMGTWCVRVCVCVGVLAAHIIGRTRFCGAVALLCAAAMTAVSAPLQFKPRRTRAKEKSYLAACAPASLYTELYMYKRVTRQKTKKERRYRAGITHLT